MMESRFSPTLSPIPPPFEFQLMSSVKVGFPVTGRGHPQEVGSREFPGPALRLDFPLPGERYVRGGRRQGRGGHHHRGAGRGAVQQLQGGLLH